MPKTDPDYSAPPPHESPEPINPPQEDPPAGPEGDAAAPERMDTVEIERHRRTMTASPPRSRTSQVGSRRASMAGGVVRGPSISDPFFAVSLFLGVSSWFIALVSQSMVAAKFGHSPIGILWFAFVLQSLLLAWLFASFFSLSPTRFSRSSSNTIAHLASMTAVLASIGVNDNIFSRNATQIATAAGWLIIAMIDVLWIIYFSTEDGSGVRAALDAGWSRDGMGGAGGVTRTEVDENEDWGEPNPRRRGFTLPGKLMPLTAPSFKLKSSRLRKSRPASTAEPKIIIEESAAENGTRPLSEAEVASAIDNRRSTAGRSLSVNPGASSMGVADSRPVSSARSATGAGGAGSTSGAGNRAKAQAMYNYKGSEGDPHELTFDKGEMFEIVDQTGKWWEVVNKEGEVGIVPSNYVRVMK